MFDENDIPDENEQDMAEPDADQFGDLSADVIDEADLTDEDSIESSETINETGGTPELAQERTAEWEPEVSEAERRLELPDGTLDNVSHDDVATELLPAIENDDSESATDSDEHPEPETSSEVYTMPEPEKPEWKAHAEKLFEERQEKQRKMLQERRQYDEKRRAEKKQYEAQLHKDKAEADAEIRESMETHRRNRKVLMDDTVKRLREEKEQKRKERQAMDEILRKEREERSYKNQRNVAPSESEESPSSPSSPPPPKQRSSDIDSRVNRLSKKEDDEGQA